MYFLEIEFNGELGSYRAIETKDGSFTLWSEYFDENCHSLEGAAQETLFNYIDICNIVERIQKNPLNILEVGFGLGHGVIQTYKSLEKLDSVSPSTFLSLEIDEELVTWAVNNQQSSSNHFPQICELEKHTYGNYVIYSAYKNGHSLIVLCGDATKVLYKYLLENPIHFDAIYQDAFSPAHNPELWSEDWFNLLFRNSNDECILSTYSCAGVAKRNLKLTGWDVKKRPGFKKKKESLIAIKN